MGKLSAEQQKQLADLEALRDADDDEETVVWVRNKDGHETRLSGERAERWLKANGYDESDADDSSPKEPLDAKGTKTAGKAPRAGKADAKGKPADDDEDDQDVTPDDQPAQRNRRAFF